MADRSHLDDATYWRTRAKEMRALAQQADASHKDFLLGMAKEYERRLVASAAQAGQGDSVQ
jgi:hypothetical protein